MKQLDEKPGTKFKPEMNKLLVKPELEKKRKAGATKTPRDKKKKVQSVTSMERS